MPPIAAVSIEILQEARKKDVWSSHSLLIGRTLFDQCRKVMEQIRRRERSVSPFHFAVK